MGTALKLVKKRKAIETFISQTKARKQALAAGAAGAAAGGAGGYALGKKKKKSMEKKSGIPAAILGGITGTIPPVGAAYGAILGYNRGKDKDKDKKLEKKGNIYLEKIASLIKESGIGEMGKALIRSKLAPKARDTMGKKISLRGFTGGLAKATKPK